MAAKGRFGMSISGSAGTIGHWRSLWGIRDTILNWFAANGYANRLEIAYAYAGPGGAWTSDSLVTENAYLVVQPANVAAFKNADGGTTRWQVVIAGKGAGAGTVGAKGGAALAIPEKSFCIAFCPNGGWDDAEGNWAGNVLGSGFLTLNSPTFPGTNFSNLFIASSERLSSVGVVNGVSLTFGWMQAEFGKQVMAHVGHYTPHVGSDLYPICAIGGIAYQFPTSPQSLFPGGFLPRKDNLAVSNAGTSAVDFGGSYGYGYTHDGKWCGRPMGIIDTSAVHNRGYLTGLFAQTYGQPNNIADGTGKFLPWNGMMIAIG